jgi:hypothetical protein
LTEIITAAAGFLIAVLWFDLMFDVQVLAHRGSKEVPETVLDSIGGSYRRVTTEAAPMGRLVGLVMVVLVGALAVQAAEGEAPVWVSLVSFAGAFTGIGLAGARVFRRARRLGAGEDPLWVRSSFARSIFRDHVVCLAAIATVLAVQLAAA